MLDGGGRYQRVRSLRACEKFVRLDVMARCNHGPRVVLVLPFWTQNLPECFKQVIEMRQEIFKMKPASRLGGILGRFWAEVGSEEGTQRRKNKSRTVFGLPFGLKIHQNGTIDCHISAVKVSNALEKQFRMKLDWF